MLNNIGKELRRLRMDHDERLFDMANRLGVSSAFLSALEHGKKSIPGGFEERVINAYQLAPAAADTLCSSADQSRKSFTIETTTPTARDTVGLLARRMPCLSEEELKSIRAILNRKAP